jgi:hypothetical protein
MTEQTNESSLDTGDAASPAPLAYATSREAEPTTGGMTRGDIASLAIRIIGIYLIVQSLPYLALSVEYFQDNIYRIVGGLVPFLACLFFGGALVIFATKIAGWLLPRTAVVATEPPGHGPAQFQAIVFSIIGVLLVVWSAPTLVYILAVFLLGSRGSIQLSPLARLTTSLSSILQYGAEFAIGIWLFFGSKRLSAWWWSMRHVEYRDASQDEQSPAEKSAEDAA